MSQSQINVLSVRREHGALSGSFVTDTAFNISRNVLADTEIKVLEKGLDFAPIKRKLK